MSDIGIIIYIDSINRCGKSGCNLKKMMMGIPMIVSDLPNNNRENIENGFFFFFFLASGDEDWYEKLELLIKKKMI